MKKGMVAVYLFVCFFALLGLTRLSYADDAQVLPKGVSSVSVTTDFYFPIGDRFNSDGDIEDAAIDFNSTLNSSVFAGLTLVELGFGLPAGSASVGNSIVDFEYEFTEVNLAYLYGVTERLSAGIIIPYRSVTNNVDARVDNSRATVGKNTTIGSLAPLPAPGVEGLIAGIPGKSEFLNTEDVKTILGPGLPGLGVSGFGFKSFENWSDEGIKDIQAGFRYQYLKTDAWRLAFSGGASFPTGKVDDPDNLADYGFGSGTYGLLFRLNNDYTGINNLVLNGTFRYNLALPDKETKRIPSDVNEPLTTNKEEVRRDLGDGFEFDLSGDYTLLKGFNASLLYSFRFKLEDEISGDQPIDYQPLQDETDWTFHLFKTGFSYSTLPLYLEGKFPFPFSGSILYENVFAGTNNIFRQQSLSFVLTSFI
jgi:hypothetical protein